MSPVNTPLRLVSLACLLALTACGGGSDGDETATAEQATAATVSDAELAQASALLDTSSDATGWTDAEGTSEADSADEEATLTASAVATASRTSKRGSSTTTTTTTTTTVADSARIAAAAATAQSSSNACSKVRPFYWEIGDSAGKKTSGSVASGSTAAVKSSAPITIASASKWLYGAYVAQARSGTLSATDRKYLAMTAGYVSLKSCSGLASVDACLASGSNGVYSSGYEGVFKYDGGHMEKHASLNGLGKLTTKALATEVRAKLGTDVSLMYSQPLMAGGAVISTDAYALFLRKVLGGKLQMKSLLGTGSVCTNPSTCITAAYAPLPLSESWHYSVGHWVEDDPKVGDGAFSSPGAFGFYPWIDATKTSYGIVARVSANGALGSVNCGRLIRSAWATGVAK
ncbi:hypothetical protein [Rubrivivax gelatinosus]|uniref:Beta-lactamase family protein n=1 Tax=Rubrivivax gelatinosus TaxID=28068 RepID=A0A4R2MA98_RUBGE|nr:hypothetical protein [Rubrivivax gelatinosus]MBK1687750.1 hypothetical protein [Rubrivivax gelatinosus]TCP03370.1 hypothetical protein EV684_10490 [Rubrivivax gelatinosus]